MACSLARDYGARLIILNALEPPFAHGRWTVELPEDHARRMMERLKLSRPCAPDLAVEYRQAEGEPAGLILRAAAEDRCDLIVMGTHGHRGIEHVLLGSVAEQVIRRAGCPVLAVRSPLPSPSPAPAEADASGPGEGPGRDVDEPRARPADS